MFLGIRTFGATRRVTNYVEAQASLEHYKAIEATKRRRRPMPKGEYPLGGHHKSVTWVRELSDGSIAFKLYDTDVVTWHPDGSVSLDNFGTVTTTSFASRFLPRGIHLRHETRGGGDNGITFNAPDGRTMICQGYSTLRPVDGGWWPDEEILPEFALVSLGKADLPELPWGDFTTWLEVAPAHLDLRHEGFDLEGCVKALQARDFREATRKLPLITIPNGWGAADRIKPLPIGVANWEKAVTIGSLRKLRLALLEHHGALVRERVKVAPLAQYLKAKRLTREFEQMGIYIGSVGF